MPFMIVGKSASAWVRKNWFWSSNKFGGLGCCGRGRGKGTFPAWLTSSLFNLIVEEDLAAFRGMRQLMIGGERLSVPHVRRFLLER